MAEANSERVEQQPPYVLAMVFCDDAYIDPSTGKKTLLGIFSAIFTNTFPARIPQLVLYIAMTDGHGITPVRIVLVDAEEEHSPIFRADNSVDFTDPRLVAEAIIGMGNLEFPAAGEYRLQLWACEQLLMERRIVVSGPQQEKIDE